MLLALAGEWTARIVEQQLAAHIDLVPTFLDIVSKDRSQMEQLELDGLSLLPVLNNEEIPDFLRDRFIFQNYHLSTLGAPAPFPGGIALQWPFKMADDSLLYQLSQDPAEAQNRAIEHPEVLQTLREAYLDWWQTLPHDSSEFALAIPVGYKEENPILLQPHHGKAIGQVKFLGQKGLLGERIGSHPTGGDGDWLGAWGAPGDGVRWLIDVQEAHSYEIAAVVRGNMGVKEAEFILATAEGSRSVKLSQPELEKGWQRIPLCDLTLQPGTKEISVRLQSSLPTGNQLDVQGLSIRKKS